MKSINIESDAQAVNFREIRVGKIAPNTLYRSSHPIKGGEQEKIISLLAAQARIGAVINLADTNSALALKAIFAPWYNKLFKDGRIIALGMDFSVVSEKFNKKLKKALQFIISTDGPWLIHCHAGVDRTGFVSIVLEAFMGAAIDEIADDYLLSFNSIFDSSIQSEINKNDSFIVMKYLSVMGNNMALNDQNLQAVAENYLRNTIKMPREEIGLLKRKLSGSTVDTFNEAHNVLCAVFIA